MKNFFDRNANNNVRLVLCNENAFVSNDLTLRNFDEYLWNELHKKGFDIIAFFDGARNLGLYFLDEDSAKKVTGQSSNPKPQTRHISAFDDDEEEIETEQETKEINLKTTGMTASQFLPTFKSLIANKSVKTAVVFSNVVDFVSNNDVYDTYYDFISHGFDYDNENLIVFAAKNITAHDLADEINKTHNQFLLNQFYETVDAANHVYKLNHLAIQLSEPDNREICLLLKRFSIDGYEDVIKHKHYSFDVVESDMDHMVEMIRQTMLKRDMLDIANAINQFVEYARGVKEDHFVVDEEFIRKIFHFDDDIEDDPYDKLMNTKGWENAAKVVKRDIEEFEKEKKDKGFHKEVTKSRYEIPDSVYQYNCPNYMILGNPGLGKTTIAKLIGKIYEKRGILRNGEPKIVKAADCLGQYIGESANKTNELLLKAKGKVLVIDEAYQLYADPNKKSNNDENGNYRQEAIDTLVAGALDPDICIILCGYDKTRKLFEMNEGMARRFKVISLDNYEPELLTDIFKDLVKKDGYTLDESIPADRFFTNFKKFSPKSSFGNAGDVEKVYRAVKQKAQQRNEYSKDIILDDFDDYQRYFMEPGKKETMDQLLHDIDTNYVGFENVKKFIESLRNGILRKQNGETKGCKVEETQRNILLAGNPGTGKTTLANLLAEFYYQMGVLGSNEVISLVASMTSAEDLALAIEKANDEGKLLFIDEANYYVTSGNYGKVAINPLLNPSEDEKNYPDLRIVCAVYPENKKGFYDLDAGMKRRFKEFNMDDYTPEQLYSIFEIMRKAEIQDISDEKDEDGFTVSDYIEAYFMYKSKSGNIEDGNAALAKKLNQDLSEHRCARVDQGEEDQITFDDFPKNNIKNVKRILYNKHNPDKALKEVYDELDKNLVGRDNIKEHFNLIKTQIEMNNDDIARGIETEPITKHLLFVGNPGTGKTTLLNASASFYTTLGLLQSEQYIDFKVQDTAKADCFLNALKEASNTGKLLCIDEANFFVKTSSGSLLIHDFVKAAEDKVNYPDLIVAMCIYPEYLNAFMALDPGMERRFQVIQLNDYTDIQLSMIFKKIADKQMITYSDETASAILEVFNHLINNGEAQRKNASLAKEVFNAINMNRFIRTKNKEENKYVIELEDVELYNKNHFA